VLLCLAALAGPALAAPAETTPVWRARVHIRVCDVSHAGTDGIDDAVKASLNDYNRTILNSAADDFDRADARYYDLLLANVTQLSDVVYLKISKDGTDGLCIQSITFYLNNAVVFYQTYGAGVWLDGANRTHLISGLTLRASSLWTAWVPVLAPPGLPADEMVSRVTAAIGTGMYKSSGGSYVRWSYGPSVSGTEGAVHVSAGLEYKCIDPNFGDGGCKDWSILYGFELHFGCAGGAIVVTVHDVGALRTDMRGLIMRGSGYVGEVLYDKIPPRIPEAFRNIRFATCPFIAYHLDGSIAFIQ
jgi:hypothetical protein